MPSIAFVNCYLLAKNTTGLTDCYLARETVIEAVPCINIEVRGVEWFVPQVVNGQFKGYTTKISTTQPTPDSVKTVRILDKMKLNTYWIIIPIGSDETVFSNNCNACCGSTPAIVPALSDMPLPIIQQCPCTDVNNNYIFEFGVPPNPNALNYQVSGVYFDNAHRTDMDGQQFSSVALLLAALNFHFGAYATFTIQGNSIQGSSTATKCMAMDIELHAANYCFTFGAATPVDSIEISGTPYAFPTGIATIDVNNPNAIVAALQKLLVGTFTLNVAGSPATGTLQYSGTQIPGRFYYNGSPATSGSPATTQKFVAGSC